MYTHAVVDVASVRFLLVALAGWLNNQQTEVLAYLVEENRILRGQLRGRNLRLTERDPHSEAWGAGVPVFLCGGGSEHGTVPKIVSLADSIGRSIWAAACATPS